MDTSSSDLIIRDDTTFVEVFRALKKRFGLPYPPDNITEDAVGIDNFNYFNQTKCLLTYSKHNFQAAVREFENFANLENLAEETLSRASSVQQSQRRQAAITKRRVQAFNQELKKQLKVVIRDGGSIATQINSRQSIEGLQRSAGKQSATERTSSVKGSEKNRQKIIDWSRNLVPGSSAHSVLSPSKLAYSERESYPEAGIDYDPDDEINEAFPDFDEEPTEEDIQLNDSGMVPMSSFRAAKLPGALPETHPLENSIKPSLNPAPSHHPPSSSKLPDTSVLSPPAKSVKSKNYNWGTYVPPDVSPTAMSPKKQLFPPSKKPLSSNAPKSVPKPDAPTPNPPTSSGPPASAATYRPRLEDDKKRKHIKGNAASERPSKRQSPSPQDIPKSASTIKPMSVAPLQAVSNSRYTGVTPRLPSYTENQMPLPPPPRLYSGESFSSDTTRSSSQNSIFQSRTVEPGTQITSFNSTTDYKTQATEESKGNASSTKEGRGKRAKQVPVSVEDHQIYDNDVPDDPMISKETSRGRREVGSFRSTRAESVGSCGSFNGSRPVMRSVTRRASPSSQLQSENEQASSRGSYSVGVSTLEEMRGLGVHEPIGSERQYSFSRETGHQSPPLPGPSPAVNRPCPPQKQARHAHISPEPEIAASSAGNQLRTTKGKYRFYDTHNGELFPGDNYHDLFQQARVPLWVQYELTRLILATEAKNSQASLVPGLLKGFLKKFAATKMSYDDAKAELKSFGSNFQLREKYSVSNIKRDAYSAIYHSPENWDNRLQFSAELVFEKDPAQPQTLKPTLRLFPLHLRAKTNRFTRKFGSHRLLHLRVPRMFDKSITLEDHNTAIAQYLSHEGFHFMGRKWRAIYHRPKNKDGDGNRIDVTKQDKSLLVTIIMFAESGPGMEPISQRSVVEWLVPIRGDNLRMTECKYYARIGLGFSTTDPTVVFETDEIEYIDDITSEGFDKNGKEVTYSLTDGCGLVSPAVLRNVATQLGLRYPPSAVQARIGSAKGLWIADPDYDLDSDEIRIKIRKDQRKFKELEDFEEHRTLEICATSKPLTPHALNLQFIKILLHNGVPFEALAELLQEDIDSEVAEVFSDGKLQDPVSLKAYVEKIKLNSSRKGLQQLALKGRIPVNLAERVVSLLESGFTLQNVTLRNWFQDILSDHCNNIKRKLHIRIAKSCYPFCVPDPTGTLQEGQIFLRFGQDSRFIDPQTMFPMDVLKGKVLIGRNPAHFSSDIQKVTAVDIPQLRHLTDVIVFPVDPSSQGRSLADYLSGGDYDGDRVWTCWDQRLLDTFVNREYAPDTVNVENWFESTPAVMQNSFRKKVQSATTFSDFIQRQLQISMRENYLGACTVFFESYLYANYGQVDLDSDDAKDLAFVCGKLVDAPKQGTWLKEDLWKRLQDTHRGWNEPYYSRKKEPLGHDLERAIKSKHPIDRLKFVVASEKIESLMKQFAESCADASYKDEDIIRYSTQILESYADLRSSQDRADHAVATTVHEQKKHLNEELGSLQDQWGAYWSHRKFIHQTISSENEKDSNECKNFIEECLENYQSIHPANANPEAGRSLFYSWLLHADNPYSEWSLLKASLLYERCYRSIKSEPPILPWLMAGDSLRFIKALAVNGSKPMNFPTEKMSLVSGVRKSALKKVDEDEWIGGDGSEELDYSDGGDE